MSFALITLNPSINSGQALNLELTKRGERIRVSPFFVLKSKPVSRVLSSALLRSPAIYLRRHLHAACFGLPIRASSANGFFRRAALIPDLFGLSTRKVYPSRLSPAQAVSSYLTISPLPRIFQYKAVSFLWHFLFPRDHSRKTFPLGSAAPFVARTFLPEQ
jgi:hypothetical protein